MLPRWQVLVERWPISMSQVGRSRVERHSRKFLMCGDWPSSPLTFLASRSISLALISGGRT